MKTTVTLLLATLLAITSYGQFFEGEIIYKNVYKSRIPNVTDGQLTSMIGSTQEYYIKGGSYKSVINGSFFYYQLYVNKDNKLYNKMANSDTLLWNDGAINEDEVLKAEVNKGVTEILGYKCDELILTCKSGIQKYYFNTKISVDAALYVQHKYGNWFDVISRTNSLPLKIIVDNPQFSIESTAITITPMKLEKSFFELPVNTQTMKSLH